MKLQDIAQVIRSKNAGPRCLTLDIMFVEESDYLRVLRSGVLNRELISRLYSVPAEAISIIDYPLGLAVKIVFLRNMTAGDPGDRDVYGAQQHTRLFDVEI